MMMLKEIWNNPESASSNMDMDNQNTDESDPNDEEMSEWEKKLEAEGSELLVKRAHEKGDVAVRGGALSLLLYLWGREPEDIEIFGDPELARIWGSLAP